MKNITRATTAFAMAQLMPNIIQGAHLGFMTKRAITQTQFLVLLSIHAKGPTPMSRIAKKMNVRMPTITGMVERLVEGGYLKRIVNPEDRRQVVIDLAPKGRDLLKQFQRLIRKRWENVLETLTQHELEEFYTIISKLNLKLGEQE